MYLLSLSLLAYRSRLSLPKQASSWGAVLALATSLLAGIVSLNAQTPASAGAKEIHIAAAADLQTVMPPLAQRYEREKGVKLVVSYGSSGNLTTQILNGEPVDLFLGADYTFPEKIVAANLADSRDAIPYAKGTLVLWTRKDTPFNPLHLEALSDPRVKKIAIADELRAPYGRAAAAALTRLKIYDQLKPKFVIGENIAQAGQFAESGNADLGLISLSMAMSEHFKQLGTYVLVPDVYPEIRQCAVVLAKSPRRTETHAFLDWLLTPEIQSELPKLGLNAVR